MGVEKFRRPIITPQDTTSVIPGLSGGGKNYSAVEQDTGRKWIDGTTPIYQITVAFGALPLTTSKSVAHGISGLTRIIAHEAVAHNSGTGINIPIPYGNTGSNKIFMYVNGTNITITTAGDQTGYDTCYVTLFYTKS